MVKEIAWFRLAKQKVASARRNGIQLSRGTPPPNGSAKRPFGQGATTSPKPEGMTRRVTYRKCNLAGAFGSIRNKDPSIFGQKEPVGVNKLEGGKFAKSFGV